MICTCDIHRGNLQAALEAAENPLDAVLVTVTQDRLGQRQPFRRGVGDKRFPLTREMTAAHTVMVEEVHAALQPYREDDDFVMPARSSLVQARAS